jgi:hypothetical protein
MEETFEWKYLITSEVILSLYDKTNKLASLYPNFNIISINTQLNSTYSTVFIMSIHVTHINFYGFHDQEFKPLAGARNFFNLKMSRWALGPPSSYWCSFPRSKMAGA